MNRQEFEEKRKSMRHELSTLNSLVAQKRREILDLHEDWCCELYKQYSKFMEKKVCIKFQNPNRENKEIEIKGFLTDFQYNSNVKDVYPVIHKIKKNGAMSLSTYSWFDVDGWDCIKSIEQI